MRDKETGVEGWIDSWRLVEGLLDALIGVVVDDKKKVTSK